MLSEDEVAMFERDGFVPIPGAVPADVIAECQAEVDESLRARDVDPEQPSTWRDPVVRLDCPWTPAYRAAGTQPVLWEAYDQLIGPQRWVRTPGVGGTIPVRLPHPDDPGDAGWHVDGSFVLDGVYGLDLTSRERGLLALFLLTDVGEQDAPTELKVSSHLDLPRVLERFGDRGGTFLEVAMAFPPSVEERPSAFATGEAGDVFLCHPFLVHRATWPHTGIRPRAIAQPAIATHEPFRLDGTDPSPVARAIVAGLTAG